ncbi:hypothetical protein JL722_4083 [Aureococcus anophagefferens]|nr:hypothetical protein JL722_4083 [Aureococcus anophagefferens]
MAAPPAVQQTVVDGAERDWNPSTLTKLTRGGAPHIASVGLNSVPTWLRPYGSLSNGERQRAALARRLGHGAGATTSGAEVDAATLRSTAAPRNEPARCWSRAAATVAARPETKAQLQTGPVAYRALAGAPKLVDLGDAAARAPAAPTRAGAAEFVLPRVSLTSRVAVDAHARAASAAFDYAHDGAVSTTVVFPPFDEAGRRALRRAASATRVGAVSGPSGSGKSTLLRGEFSGKAPLPPQPPGATVFEAVRAGAAGDAAAAAGRCAVPRLWGVADWRALSRGERSLVDVARHLRDGAVLDEFCTGVDAGSRAPPAPLARSAAGSLAGLRLRDASRASRRSRRTGPGPRRTGP